MRCTPSGAATMHSMRTRLAPLRLSELTAAEARDFILLDPMLATGGSASAAVAARKQKGATRVRMLCMVAAPEGVQRMLDDHPDVHVYAAALDRELNDVGYILPGLGDAGDRLFGTR